MDHAQLLQHGLLKPELHCPEPIRDLRDLTRQRTVLIRDRGGSSRIHEGVGGCQHQAGGRGQ